MKKVLFLTMGVMLGNVGAMVLKFDGIVNDKLTLGVWYPEEGVGTYERGHGQPSFEN